MAVEPHESDVTALEALAAELRARSLDPVITNTGGRPVLTVSNPDAPALSESVLEDAGLFRWSWEEEIGPVGDVSGAADAIARVLARSST
jgi:hypothetical protein